MISIQYIYHFLNSNNLISDNITNNYNTDKGYKKDTEQLC